MGSKSLPVTPVPVKLKTPPAGLPLTNVVRSTTPPVSQISVTVAGTVIVEVLTTFNAKAAGVAAQPPAEV